MKLIRKIAVSLIVICALAGVLFLSLYLALQPPALVVPEKRNFVIADVSVINPGSEALYHQTVIIKDGIVISIEPFTEGDTTSEGILLPEDAIIFPGLMDMHVHFPPSTAVGNNELFNLMYLYYGVTTVRDMGSLDGSIFKWREKVRAGEIPGPRIFTPGKILDGNPPSWPIVVSLSSEEEAEKAVRKQVEDGADFIKVYSKLSLPLLRAIQATAEELGYRVAGHCPMSISFRNAHIEDVQHFEDVFSFALPENRLEWLINKQEVWEKLTEKDFLEIVDISKEQNIVHTPTLINMKIREHINDINSPEAQKLTENLPRFWSQVTWNPEYSTYSDEEESGFDQDGYLKKCRILAKHLFDKGLIVRAGTDVTCPFVIPGLSLLMELEEFKKLGVSDERCLITATTDGGTFFDRTPGLGTVSVGAPADLLILKKNPTDNIEFLSEKTGVIADSRYYSQETLEEYIEIYRNHFRGWLYDTVSIFLSKIITRWYSG